MKTFSFNGACFKMDCMFGNKLTSKTYNDADGWYITEFYVNGEIAADYSEKTGVLNIRPKFNF